MGSFAQLLEEYDDYRIARCYLGTGGDEISEIVKALLDEREDRQRVVSSLGEEAEVRKNVNEEVVEKLRAEVEELKAQVEKQKRLTKEIYSIAGPDAVRERQKKTIKKMDRFLAKFAGCSSGRPVDTILAAAEEAAAKLKAKGTADHPRIAKVLEEVRTEKRGRDKLAEELKG